MILRYNIDTKMDFYRPEIEALESLLEGLRKTFTLVKVDSMKLIKKLGLKYSETQKRRHQWGLFECGRCGEHIERTMINGETSKVCQKCVGYTHGMTGTRPHGIWRGLIARTTSKNHKNYDKYKDRKPPEKWLSFEGFWEDMEEGYKDGLTIDRINNDKPYSKENCRWATYQEQSDNVGLLTKSNTSGYRGVGSHTCGMFQGEVAYKKVRKYIGLFRTAKEAAIAVDDFVIANNIPHKLNFPKRMQNG